MLKLETITTLEQFHALTDEWNTLLHENATQEIFLTHEWQRTWWDAYHPGQLFIILGRNDANELIGIAPWFIEDGTRMIRFIGCVEVTDYLDMLVRPAEREAFFAALAECLRSCADTYGKLDVCNIPSDSPTLEAMSRIFGEHGFTVNIKEQEICPVITLPDTFEQYLEQLDKKQRHEARRKMRRAEENPDKVAWYIVGPDHDLDTEIKRFLDLMAASHPLKATFLDDPQNMDFFMKIAPLVAEHGWLQLVFLTVNGEAIATYFNFDYHNRILVYNSGLRMDKYANLSAGNVLLLYNIRHAIEQGRDEFDFLRGQEEYKFRLGGQPTPVMSLSAIPNKSI